MVPARFLERPNRFIAYAEVDGQKVVAHVKNTGRCKELLPPGAQVYLQKADNTARKTPYDLVQVFKADPSLPGGGRLINMDSQAPNKVAEEWLRAGGLGAVPTLLKPECRYGASRFDFYLELPGETAEPRRIFMEVKGVTLEVDGACFFPDAPTERGLKHVEELIACRQAGYEAVLLFVVQMKPIKSLSPNRATQPAFADALLRARDAGVRVLAYDCLVTPGSLTMDAPVPVLLL